MDTVERAKKKEEDRKKRGSGSLVERVVEVDKTAQKTSGIGTRGIGTPGAGKPGIGSLSSDEPKRDPSAMGAAQSAGDEKPKSKGIGIGSAAARKAREENADDPANADTAETAKSGGIGSSAPKGVGGIGSAGARGKAGTADKLLDADGNTIEPIRSTRPKPGQASQGAGGAEVAAQAPAKAAEAPAKVAQAKAAQGARAPGKPAKKRPVEEVDLIALRDAGYITPDMPSNLMAEEFRIIKRSIVMNAFAQGDAKIENGNVIMVTSSSPSEGKTFCAINLALSIATEQDVTVLLIDADFSKPEILNRLGVSGGRGLMDVVADDSFDLGDCLVRTNIPNLVLLPAGRQHNLTTELLASDRMKNIVKEISSRYPDRIVIFDSPPVLASSAASVLALYMGQTVFVIEAERTTEPQIKESLNMVSSCENISLLLNKTKFGGGNKKFATYYGYGGR